MAFHEQFRLSLKRHAETQSILLLRVKEDALHFLRGGLLDVQRTKLSDGDVKHSHDVVGKAVDSVFGLLLFISVDDGETQDVRVAIVEESHWIRIAERSIDNDGSFPLQLLESDGDVHGHQNGVDARQRWSRYVREVQRSQILEIRSYSHKSLGSEHVQLLQRWNQSEPVDENLLKMNTNGVVSEDAHVPSDAVDVDRLEISEHVGLQGDAAYFIDWKTNAQKKGDQRSSRHTNVLLHISQ